MKRLLYKLLCMLCIASSVDATPFVYNLNVVDGLPSNHIYGMLVDRNGYLWVATPEGVARYNGYGVKVFNVADGLPTADIWEVFEDKKGRLWLLSFAQSLGYIFNDQYKQAIIWDSSARIFPAPQTMYDHNNGVFFRNDSREMPPTNVFLVEENDTFRIYINDFRGQFVKAFLRKGNSYSILTSGADNAGMRLLDFGGLSGP